MNPLATNDVAAALELAGISLATAKGAEAVLDIEYERDGLCSREIEASCKLAKAVTALELTVDLLTGEGDGDE